MKYLYLIFCLTLISFPILAADDLKPEPLEQAVTEFKSFWDKGTPDPMNHEIWKLYVFSALLPGSGMNRSTQTLLTGLSAGPPPHHYVLVGINQLWNFLHSTPQPGDVLVVEGRIVNHINSHITTPNKYLVLKALVMYPENAELIPSEHFQVSATPTLTYLKTTPSVGVIPTSAAKSPVETTPGIPDKGFR